MTTDWLERTELLLGKDEMSKLLRSNVLVVGLGGVGSFAAEFIARAGVGKMTIVDADTVDRTNRNRQLPALFSTEGQWKADVMAERLLDINPELDLTVKKVFVKDDIAEEILNEDFDWVVDAIDSLAPKVYLIARAYNKGIRVVSSMGAGGKLDPTKVEIASLHKVHHCKLAHYVKKKLNRMGIRKGVTAIFSPEEVSENALRFTDGLNNKKSFYGTISYMPAMFGLCAGSVVVRSLAGIIDISKPQPVTGNFSIDLENNDNHEATME